MQVMLNVIPRFLVLTKVVILLLSRYFAYPSQLRCIYESTERMIQK